MLASILLRPRVIISILVAIVVAPCNVSKAHEASVVYCKTHLPINGDAIIAPVRINSVMYNFIVDTGAGPTYYDRSLTNILTKQPLENTTAPPSASNSDVVAMYLGDAKLKDIDLTRVLDFSEVSKTLGRDIHGVLGMLHLKEYVLEFDYNQQQFLILSPDSKSIGPWKETAQIVYDEWRRPHIGANIGGTHKAFLIDTGCTGISLDGVLFRSLVDKGAVSVERAIKVNTASGVRLECLGILNDFAVGNWTHQQLVVQTGICNVIGLSYLRRFQIRLDFHSGCLFMRESKYVDVDDYPDRTEMRLIGKNKSVSIEHIGSGGIADKAGLRIGDEVVRIGSCSRRDSTICDMRNQLKRPLGTEIGIVVNRNGSEISARLIVENRIDSGTCD